MAAVILGFEYGAGGTRFDANTQTGAWARAGFAVLPAIVVAAISFESQIVPDAKCANEGITFRIGAQDLTFGPEYRANIRPVGIEAQKTARNSSETENKDALKNLCDKSENGQEPLPVEQARFHGSWLRAPIERACTNSPRPRPVYCQGYTDESLHSIGALRILSPEAKSLRYFGGWFQHEDDPKVFKGGTLGDGYLCIGDDEPPRSIRCIVLRPLGSDTTVRAEGHVKPDRTREQTISALNADIDFVLSVFDP